jgi:hypothetical protein
VVTHTVAVCQGRAVADHGTRQRVVGLGPSLCCTFRELTPTSTGLSVDFVMEERLQTALVP